MGPSEAEGLTDPEHQLALPGKAVRNVSTFRKHILHDAVSGSREF